jgi:hypothetical protein
MSIWAGRGTFPGLPDSWHGLMPPPRLFLLASLDIALPLVRFFYWKDDPINDKMCKPESPELLRISRTFLVDLRVDRLLWRTSWVVL